MSEKKIKARLQQKHDTSANWALATNFKPKAGELIIYDDLKKMKVGDGETLVNNLPFLSADVSANPPLSGSEMELAGLQIGSTKYKIVTQTYVDNAIGNIDTLLTALNSGTGV